MTNDYKPSGLKSVDRLQKFSTAMQKTYKLRDFKGDAAKVEAKAKALVDDVKSEVDEVAANLGDMASVGPKNLNERIAKPAGKAAKGFAARVKKLL